jgi:hypothetical protein
MFLQIVQNMLSSLGDDTICTHFLNIYGVDGKIFEEKLLIVCKLSSVSSQLFQHAASVEQTTLSNINNDDARVDCVKCKQWKTGF